jgi:hypothetical protein
MLLAVSGTTGKIYQNNTPPLAIEVRLPKISTGQML